MVHCDLKPENVLLKERGKTAVKVGSMHGCGASCGLWPGAATPVQPLCTKAFRDAGDRLWQQLLRGQAVSVLLYSMQLVGPWAGGCG